MYVCDCSQGSAEIDAGGLTLGLVLVPGTRSKAGVKKLLMPEGTLEDSSRQEHKGSQ